MQALVVVSATAVYASHEYYTAGDGANRSLVRNACLAVIVLVVGCATGAVQLLSSAEYSSLALRWMGAHALPASQKVPYADMNDNVNSPQSIAAALFSYAFDGKVGTGEFWTPYMGVFPFILVVIGVWKKTARIYEYATQPASGWWRFSIRSVPSLP